MNKEIVRFSLNLQIDLIEKLKAKASDMGITVSALIRLIIQKYLKDTII